MTIRIWAKTVSVGTGALLVASVGIAAPVQAATYPPAPKPVSCSAKAVSHASKIKINMGPNLPGKQYYIFRLEKKTSSGWARYLKKYKTQGKSETRTINVGKGTWRAKCYSRGFPKSDPRVDATSNSVRIKK